LLLTINGAMSDYVALADIIVMHSTHFQKSISARLDVQKMFILASLMNFLRQPLISHLFLAVRLDKPFSKGF
jgi:hypothetical protein